eukprot:TRINITY_DN8224_c0_g1_i1.p1 TRINITY_DN8224_c0_g1~~TRINITY_DN8224_c0_g1_i1.p1  ORF type:complete len:1557 (+),score=305.26 TRINITY_DN8224_c0_g1_i1:134-4804(+)
MEGWLRYTLEDDPREDSPSQPRAAQSITRAGSVRTPLTVSSPLEKPRKERSNSKSPRKQHGIIVDAKVNSMASEEKDLSKSPSTHSLNRVSSFKKSPSLRRFSSSATLEKTKSSDQLRKKASSTEPVVEPDVEENKILQETLAYFKLTENYLFVATRPSDINIHGRFFALSGFNTPEQVTRLESQHQFSCGFALKNHRTKLYCYAESKKEAHEWLAKVTEFHSKVAVPKWRQRTRKRSAGATDKKVDKTSSFVQDELSTRQDSYYTVEIKVSEAKNMVPPGGTKFRSVITCDSEMDQTTLYHCTSDPPNPIWAENFRFIVPNPAGPCDVTVFSVDGNTSKIKGRVRLHLQDHIRSTDSLEGTEKWHSLVPIKTEEFTSGSLHLAVMCNDNTLQVTVISASNLSRVGRLGNNSSYLVRVQYGSQVHKTKAVRRALNPIFNETLTFTHCQNGQYFETLTATLFPISKLGKYGTNMGYVYIKCPNSEYSGEIFHGSKILEPEPVEEETGTVESSGDLRLTVFAQLHKLYPLYIYSSLLDYLLSTHLESFLALLEKTTTGNQRERMANTLVNIFEYKNSALVALKALVSREARDSQEEGSDTLFRSNSIATKALEWFMKQHGQEYLVGILKPTIKAIFKEKRTFETTSGKNLKLLIEYSDMLLHTIYNSLDAIPGPLRILFKHVASECTKYFPQVPDIGYIGIAVFFFLRFISAAILGPKLFHLVDSFPEPVVAKNLAVLSSTVTKIATMVTRDSASHSEFDEYLLYQQSKMREFLNKCLQYEGSKVASIPSSIRIEQELSYLIELLEDQYPTIEKIYLDPNTTDINCIQDLIEVLDELQVKQEQHNTKENFHLRNPEDENVGTPTSPESSESLETSANAKETPDNPHPSKLRKRSHSTGSRESPRNHVSSGSQIRTSSPESHHSCAEGHHVRHTHGGRRTPREDHQIAGRDGRCTPGSDGHRTPGSDGQRTPCKDGRRTPGTEGRLTPGKPASAGNTPRSLKASPTHSRRSSEGGYESITITSRRVSSGDSSPQKMIPQDARTSLAPVPVRSQSEDNQTKRIKRDGDPSTWNPEDLVITHTEPIFHVSVDSDLFGEPRLRSGSSTPLRSSQSDGYPEKKSKKDLASSDSTEEENEKRTYKKDKLRVNSKEALSPGMSPSPGTSPRTPLSPSPTASRDPLTSHIRVYGPKTPAQATGARAKTALMSSAPGPIRSASGTLASKSSGSLSARESGSLTHSPGQPTNSLPEGAKPRLQQLMAKRKERGLDVPKLVPRQSLPSLIWQRPDTDLECPEDTSPSSFSSSSEEPVKRTMSGSDKFSELPKSKSSPILARKPHGALRKTDSGRGLAWYLSSSPKNPEAILTKSVDSDSDEEIKPRVLKFTDSRDSESPVRNFENSSPILMRRPVTFLSDEEDEKKKARRRKGKGKEIEGDERGRGRGEREVRMEKTSAVDIGKRSSIFADSSDSDEDRWRGGKKGSGGNSIGGSWSLGTSPSRMSGFWIETANIRAKRERGDGDLAGSEEDSDEGTNATQKIAKKSSHSGKHSSGKSSGRHTPRKNKK